MTRYSVVRRGLARLTSNCCRASFAPLQTARRHVKCWLVIGALLLCSSIASASEQDRRHCISGVIGGQIGFAEYKSWLKVGAGYAYRIANLTWLDVGSTVLAHKETNFTIDAGVRWKFRDNPVGVRPFLRTGLQIAMLFEGPTRGVIGARVGGGAGYFASPGFGMTLEAGAVMGPSFGAGLHFAAGMDLLLGFEFPL
jgi:hypothetical protein